MGLANINVPVTDIEAAKKLYGALLGVEPHTDTPYYVGYNVDGLEIALNPSGANQGMKGSTPYWASSDLDAQVSALEAAGAQVTQPATEIAPNVRLATLVDGDGNAFGLITG